MKSIYSTEFLEKKIPSTFHNHKLSILVVNMVPPSTVTPPKRKRKKRLKTYKFCMNINQCKFGGRIDSGAVLRHMRCSPTCRPYILKCDCCAKEFVKLEDLILHIDKTEYCNVANYRLKAEEDARAKYEPLRDAFWQKDITRLNEWKKLWAEQLTERPTALLEQARKRYREQWKKKCAERKVAWREVERRATIEEENEEVRTVVDYSDIPKEIVIVVSPESKRRKVEESSNDSDSFDL
jgi:hypothetical protein